ncbi:MAG: peptidoglycan DD-metalloendopeptidase family protein [Chloroflexi bacterium]|nr:peptidoglycan DD-metalloendopeptidase family protein [Chloroflexota bacterium]
MLHRVALAFIAALLLALVSSEAIFAAGPPLPPKSPFAAPPTPTLASLPTPSPTPTPASFALQKPFEIPEPGGGQRLFLPWIGAYALFGSSERGLEGESNPRVERFVYEVKAGDALNDLAIEFGRDQRTMRCARNEDGTPIRSLRPGQRIVIPALSDLCHRVKAGEDLSKIAAWYGVTVESLRAAPQNRLQKSGKVRPGQYLLIPNARSRYRDPLEARITRRAVDHWRYGSGAFIWPLERDKAWVTQGFRHGKHMAIDIAAPKGTKVYAADTGVVIKAGWSEIGYGYRIVIDHGIDYVTLYAHLSEYYVKPGDVVRQGDVIGAVGSTGNSTGPHLHFEIRDYGYLVDPLMLLEK